MRCPVYNVEVFAMVRPAGFGWAPTVCVSASAEQQVLAPCCKEEKCCGGRAGQGKVRGGIASQGGKLLPGLQRVDSTADGGRWYKQKEQSRVAQRGSLARRRGNNETVCAAMLVHGATARCGVSVGGLWGAQNHAA